MHSLKKTYVTTEKLKDIFLVTHLPVQLPVKGVP